VESGGLGDEPAGEGGDPLGRPAEAGRAQLGERQGDRRRRHGREPVCELFRVCAELLAATRIDPHGERGALLAAPEAQ
jgi:hypothetical protein